MSILTPDPSLSFCLFRIPERGGRVIWEVTNSCNYSCGYCIFGSHPHKPQGELDTARALEVVDELAASGFTHLKVTGGEPLVRRDAIDILERAVARGMVVDMSTNASRVDADTAARLAQLDLEFVHVSLDGPTAEIQESIRGPRTYAPTIAGIRRLVAAGCRVRIGTVIFDGNEDHLAEIAELCSELGVAEIVFSRMEPLGQFRGTRNRVAQADDATLEARIDAIRPPAGLHVRHAFAGPTNGTAPATCAPCPGGERFLFIDHKGRVSPCTWVSERAPSLTAPNSLATSSLAEILSTPAFSGFKGLARRLAKGGLGGCPMTAAETALAIAEAPRLLSSLDRDGPKYAQRAPVYAFATETVLDAFQALVRPGDRVLTVGGSGDQIVAASLAGAAHIHAFDINLYAAWWWELKRAAHRVFNLERFRSFFHPESAQALSLADYRAIRPQISAAARLFFDALYEAADDDGARLRRSTLFRPVPSLEALDRHVAPWLVDAALYARVRARLEASQITWRSTDIRSLKTDAIYDVVYLSNLADRLDLLAPGADDLDGFRNFLLGLAPRLAPGRRLMAAYVYDATSPTPHGPIDNKAARQAVLAHLPGWHYAEHLVPSALDTTRQDVAVVLTREA